MKTNIEIVLENGKVVAFNSEKFKNAVGKLTKEDIDLTNLETFFFSLENVSFSKIEWEGLEFYFEYIPLFTFKNLELIIISEILKKEEKTKTFQESLTTEKNKETFPLENEQNNFKLEVNFSEKPIFEISQEKENVKETEKSAFTLETIEKPKFELQTDFSIEESQVSQENAVQSENLQQKIEEITKKEETQDELSLSITPKKDEKIKIKLNFNIQEEEGDILDKLKKDIELSKKELELDDEMFNMLFKNLLEDIEKQKRNIYNALNSTPIDYESLHKITHTLKGAALNLRITLLSDKLREIDTMARQKEATPNELKEKIDKFYEIFYKIKDLYD